MVALEIDREQLREDAKTAFQVVLIIAVVLLMIVLLAVLEVHKWNIPAPIEYGLNTLPYLAVGAYIWYWVRDRYTVEENAGTSEN